MSKAETLAQKLGCELLVDDVAVRACCPDGWCFEPGLHELVENHGRMDGTVSEATKRMAERLIAYQSIEKCEIENCEWCQC